MLVTSGASQGSILGPILFNIFTNDIEEKTKCTPIKFVDNIKLGKNSHRNTENFKLEGILLSYLVQAPLKAGLVRPGSTGPLPAEFWISPRMEISQILWMCSSV